jgi:hypothetical protein
MAMIATNRLLLHAAGLDDLVVEATRHVPKIFIRPFGIKSKHNRTDATTLFSTRTKPQRAVVRFALRRRIRVIILLCPVCRNRAAYLVVTLNAPSTTTI